MEQELKQQAYRVLINKIDIACFEKKLYQLVENKELKYKSLLFDLVCINYRGENYKKEIINLIEMACSEEELLCLKVYEKCLKIIEYKNHTEILTFIGDLSNRYLDDEYEIFYNFYRFNDVMDLLEIGYSGMNEEQIIKNAKEYSELIIDKFNFYKKEEDWIGFLTDSSYNNFDYSKKQKGKTNILKKEKSNSFFSLILNFVGLQ